MSSSALPLSQRVRLAHAAVDYLAESEGIRVLHIKGPLAAAQFPERPSGLSDVDVLVDPERAIDLVTALTQRGWQAEASSAYPTSNHAIVLTEDTTFHCTFDLHVRYPGITLADQEAFETLWAQRTETMLAQRTLNTLLPSAHAQILLLEAARNYADDPVRNSKKVDGVMQALDTRQWEAFWALAHTTGAARILASLLPDAPDSPQGLSASPAWELRMKEGGGLAIWWARISDAPTLSCRIRIALQALVPHAAYGEDPDRRWTLADVVRRWRRGSIQVARLMQLKIGALILPGVILRSAVNRMLNKCSLVRVRIIAPKHEGQSADHQPTSADINAMADQGTASGKSADTAEVDAVHNSVLPWPLPDLTNQQLACVELGVDSPMDNYLAVLPLPTYPIVVLNISSALLWLAHMDPSISSPINTVIDLYDDPPEDAAEILHQAEHRLRLAGVIPS